MRRWGTRIAVLLIIGAVINVAVAWGFALAPNPSKFRGKYVRDYFALKKNGTDQFICRSPGELRIYECYNAGSAPLLMARANSGPGVTPTEFTAMLPWWAAWHSRQPLTERQRTQGFLEQANGWPMLSLRMEAFDFGDNCYSYIRRRMWHLPERPFGGNSRNQLPLNPTWPGFGMNTALYACVVWLLFIAPFDLRRARRRREGCCSKCGYDLRGSSAVSDRCPECGTRSTHTCDAG